MSKDGVEESEMDIRAGLRWSEGRERMRVRRARPSDQAVVEVNDGKRTEGEDSRAARAGGCADIFLLADCLMRDWGFWARTSTLGVLRGVRSSILAEVVREEGLRCGYSVDAPRYILRRSDWASPDVE